LRGGGQGRKGQARIKVLKKLGGGFQGDAGGGIRTEHPARKKAALLSVIVPEIGKSRAP